MNQETSNVESAPAVAVQRMVRPTATEPPIFPCWLWETQLHLWWRCTGYPRTLSLQMYNSHWHPDQPDAPTCRPNDPSSATCAGDRRGAQRDERKTNE